MEYSYVWNFDWTDILFSVKKTDILFSKLIIQDILVVPPLNPWSKYHQLKLMWLLTATFNNYPRYFDSPCYFILKTKSLFPLLMCFIFLWQQGMHDVFNFNNFKSVPTFLFIYVCVLHYCYFCQLYMHNEIFELFNNK